MHRERARIEAAGATLQVIGNGAPMFMAGFRETTGYDGGLYTDPSLAVYQALELRRGWATILAPRAAKNAARALAGGFRQGRTQGDATQQGGETLGVGTTGAGVGVPPPPPPPVPAAV